MEIDKIQGPLIHNHKGAYKNWFLNLKSATPQLYRYLYNWFAAVDERAISAQGWHVPSVDEFDALVAYVGGANNGGKLKAPGTDYWTAPNAGATGAFAFNALPGGGRNGNDGNFYDGNDYTGYWTTDLRDASGAWTLALYSNLPISVKSVLSKKIGISIRLIKDVTTLSEGQTGTYTGNDGKSYNTICINGQEWTENILETEFRNGELIPNVSDNAEWIALESAGICTYNNEVYNEPVGIFNQDLLEIEAGDNISLELAGKKLKISGSNQSTAITSNDQSIEVSETESGYDLSVSQRGEFIAYADNEAELLTAWTAAIAANKAGRIYITNNITFTANRQFVNLNSAPGIKIEAIQNRYFIAGNYTIDFNNVTLINIVFRTTGASYLRIVGGLATFENCAWIDDSKDQSIGGAPKKNIIVCDPITAGAAKIILKRTTHFTQVPDDNNGSLIQPFWIENQATFVGDNASLYVECLEMAAVSSFDRFSRLLLTSTVADCPFKVTGDESWFYAPAQEMPGMGYIKATASILRTTTVDKFNAPKLISDDTADYVIGMRPDGTAVKRIARTDDYYGIMWDVNVSSPACARIGKMELHRELPIQSLMRGCLLKDDGTINYYLDALDWTKKIDGTASILDGTDGQVMVEIPSHYRKFESFLSLRKVKISQYPLTGFTYVPKNYIAAFEATVQRSTNKLASVINLTADYRGGNNNAALDAETRTLLGRPATNISRIDFRTYARNRGSVNWNMITYDAYKALFWLYFIEYGNLNSQAAFNAAKDANGCAQGGLGNGVTDIDNTKWGAWNSNYPFVPCGQSNSLGNYSGEVSFNMPAEYDAAIKTTKVNRYRGIENPFGHIWKWTDGVNIEMQAADSGALTKMWTCSNPANFSNVDYANYTLIGGLPRVEGYIKEMLLGEILPSNLVGGGSSTFFCDYGYYANLPASGIGLRGVFFGGNADTGAKAGFGYSTIYAPSFATPSIGSRLCFLGT